MAWVKTFCEVPDAGLNSDLQFLAAATEIMHERSANCCPLCLSTRFHHPLLWGSRKNVVFSSEPLQFKAWCTLRSTWRAAQICHPSLNGQWRVHKASSSFLSSGSKSKCHPSGLKTDVPAVVGSQAQQTHGALLEPCCSTASTASPAAHPAPASGALVVLSHHLVPHAIILGIATQSQLWSVWQILLEW